MESQLNYKGKLEGQRENSERAPMMGVIERLSAYGRCQKCALHTSHPLRDLHCRQEARAADEAVSARFSNTHRMTLATMLSAEL